MYPDNTEDKGLGAKVTIVPQPNNKYVKKQIHHNLHYLYFSVYKLIMLTLWFVSTSGYSYVQFH